MNVLDYEGKTPVKGAQIGDRFLAALITVGQSLAWVITAAWFLSFPFPLQEYMTKFGYSSVTASLVPIGITFGFPFAWNLGWSAFTKKTYGMRKMGLEFTTEDGRRPSAHLCVARSVLGLMCSPLFIISLILIERNRKRRWTLPDYVIRIVITDRNK